MQKIGYSPVLSYSQYYRNNPSFQRHQEPIITTEEPKKKPSYLKKGLLATGAVLLAIGIAAITKGKAKIKVKQPVNNLEAIPQDLRARFEKLKGLEGDEFVQKSYNELVEHMNLKGIAPKEIIKHGNDGVMTVTGGYDVLNRTIGYSDGFWKKLSKEDQICMLAHELKHCEQFTNIARTEGLGLQKMIEAEAELGIKEALSPNSLDFNFKIQYEKACQNGKKEEFIEKLRNSYKTTVQNILEGSHSDIVKMPKIKADSPEGQKAFKDYKAYTEYEGLGIFGFGSEKYRNNPLEAEAYGFGDSIKKYFKDFFNN